MGFSTPFTKAFNITVPVCLAPMAGVSGGKLAAAVARGGGLGVIAAGSARDIPALDDEVDLFRDEAPAGARLVIGIISWAALGVDGYGITEASLHQNCSVTRSADIATINGSGSGSGSGSPTESSRAGEASKKEGEEACGTRLLEMLLDRHQPDAIWFFAPATPSKEAYSLCLSRGVEIIAQVGTVSEARTASEMGASVVVAQGREAGGHGLRPEIGRGTLPLAAAVVVELAETGKTVLAAGGVVSGRGLLAALALGCDGVVMGTRYCATNESLMSEDHKAKVVITSGDETVRTRVYDMAAAARPSNPVVWPEPYDSSGVAANDFTRAWHTRETKLAEELSQRDGLTGFSAPTLQLEDAERSRNLAVGRVFLGEGAGLIYSVEGAEKITREVEREAEEQLDNVNKFRSLRRGSARMMSLSAENVEDLDVRDRRAYTASALPNNSAIRPPGTRQVISSGTSYEKLAGYSRAVRVGKHVQVAGTTATSPDGSGVLCVGDVEGQTQYIFHIIALALREAGCALENVVRTRMFVTDIANAEKVMAEHNKIFNAIRPAATILMVSALVHPDLLIEIEADALEP